MSKVSAEAAFLRPGEETLYQGRPRGYPPPNVRFLVYGVLLVAHAPLAFSPGPFEHVFGLSPFWIATIALVLACVEGIYFATWRSAIFVVTSAGRLLEVRQLVFARLIWALQLEGNETVLVRTRDVHLKEAFGTRTWALSLRPEEAKNFADALRRATGSGPEAYPIVDAAEPEGRLARLARLHWKLVVGVALPLALSALVFAYQSQRAQRTHVARVSTLEAAARGAITAINTELEDAGGAAVPGAFFAENNETVDAHGFASSTTTSRFSLRTLPVNNQPTETVLVQMTCTTGFVGDSAVVLDVPNFSQRGLFVRALRARLKAAGIAWTERNPPE